MKNSRCYSMRRRHRVRKMRPVRSDATRGRAAKAGARAKRRLKVEAPHADE